VNSFIENLDGSTLLTSAQVQLSIQQYQVLAAAAEYEKEIAIQKY